MFKVKILKDFNNIRYNRIDKLKIFNNCNILKEGLKYILNNNTANNAGYHNFSHLIDTVNYYNFLYKYSNDINKDDFKLKTLLLAALLLF